MKAKLTMNDEVMRLDFANKSQMYASKKGIIITIPYTEERSKKAKKNGKFAIGVSVPEWELFVKALGKWQRYKPKGVQK